ncbi:hypothetical protein C3L33_02629, partial [Rhododendron williamsianum]
MLVMKMKAVQIDEAHDLEVNGKSVDSALEVSVSCLIKFTCFLHAVPSVITLGAFSSFLFRGSLSSPPSLFIEKPEVLAIWGTFETKTKTNSV